MLRSPICSVLGHVDHGKSSILDKIRGTAVAAGEAGGITQAIGASIIPLDTIKKICGSLLKSLNISFTIPGVLFVDTPGHAAFTNLRKRGGSLADIAIVVIDINEGFKPQTEEAIEILKASKTPFVIAANKIDLIHGWKKKDMPILASMQQQAPEVITAIETKLYQVVGQVYELVKMEAERFDRVEDYTKKVAVIPCSAKTGEGLPELLMVLTGLAQRYLEQDLGVNVKGAAKGSILEVKEEKGLGKTMDVIIYDGTLKVGDQIVIGNIGEPIVTKVKALFEPAPLAEMREKKTKFKGVKEAVAATGVKIAAPEIDNVIAGMPIISVGKNIEETKKAVMSQVSEVIIETEKEGLVIKADNLGSLEALIHLLKEKNIPIRKANIGNITKKDIADAESNYEKDPLMSVVLGFNVSAPEDVKKASSIVYVITNDVIYRLIDDFEKWRNAAAKSIEEKELDNVVRPCKVQVLTGYVFRQSNPAVVGCEVLNGTAKTGMPLMNASGKEITVVNQMQKDKENVKTAERGSQLAVSMPNVTVGRQVKEGDILYSAVPEDDFRKMKELKKYLTRDEIEAIKEIAEIKRKINAVWGI